MTMYNAVMLFAFGLIMLINTTREDCSIVEDRINRKFKTEGQRTGLRYNISNVEGKFL